MQYSVNGSNGGTNFETQLKYTRDPFWITITNLATQCNKNRYFIGTNNFESYCTAMWKVKKNLENPEIQSLQKIIFLTQMTEPISLIWA